MREYFQSLLFWVGGTATDCADYADFLHKREDEIGKAIQNRPNLRIFLT